MMAERGPIPGDAYDDPNLLPEETDPATGETADDALEATRTVPEYLMPAEDASPIPVDWSVHPTEDSTQEAEWEEPFNAPFENATGGEDDSLNAAQRNDTSIDRIVDETYFEREGDDLNDDEEAALNRVGTPDDPHPDSQTPDVADEDTISTDTETTRGESARR
jgi:hypothetical protein